MGVIFHTSRRIDDGVVLIIIRGIMYLPFWDE